MLNVASNAVCSDGAAPGVVAGVVGAVADGVADPDAPIAKGGGGAGVSSKEGTPPRYSKKAVLSPNSHVMPRTWVGAFDLFISVGGTSLFK